MPIEWRLISLSELLIQVLRGKSQSTGRLFAATTLARKHLKNYLTFRQAFDAQSVLSVVIAYFYLLGSVIQPRGLIWRVQ